jgi:hypothetical protein
MSDVRDVIWLVADLECRATLTGFLDRKDFHTSLRCKPFLWNPDIDLIREEKGKDAGVWKNSHLLLRAKRISHRHAVVLLDNAFDGSPGPEQLEHDIRENLQRVGWSLDDVEVIVLDPELEVWIWQRNVNVEQAFDYSGPPGLWKKLAELSISPAKRFVPADPDRGLVPAWPEHDPKPRDPKATVEAVRWLCNSDPPSAVFNSISARVSVRGCVDPGFLKLRGALQRWFPPEGVDA